MLQLDTKVEDFPASVSFENAVFLKLTRYENVHLGHEINRMWAKANCLILSVAKI